MSRKILVIGMLNSIHLVRWLDQFKDEGLEFYLFPSTPIRKLHPGLEKLLNSNYPSKFEMAWKNLPLAYFFGILDYFLFRNKVFGRVLARRIRKIHPDVIHIHEFQHAGYIFLESRKFLKTIPKIIIGSNWGSDIFWFQQFPKHRDRLTKLMKLLTHYSAECKRDISLAKNLGFNGVQMPVVPNSGGFQKRDNIRTLIAPSKRKIIVVKGYTRFVGKAEFSIEVLSRISKNLASQFDVAIYSTSFKARMHSKFKLRKFKSINVYKPHELTHAEMIDLFESARIYIGASKSDGISTSMLEAMYAGAFPLQTNTSCADEWIENMETGFLLNLNNLAESVYACEQSLSNDQLVDRAQELNLNKIETYASAENVRDRLKNYYVFNQD